MGILFTRIWRLFNHQEHKVIIVGLDNAGKTTILYQFSMNEVVHTSPTIGSNVEEIVINNTRFLMWDIGGQESLRSSWNTYYTNTEFVIVVVDSTDRERISVTREELYKMLAHEILHSFFHVYLYLRERQSASGGDGRRERESQNLKQAPGSELSVQILMQGLNSQTEIMT
uniref:ADP ribosylation factor like GTPase 5A n=1 Tax=Felis catus TaxID=9685 RepID=A0ABI7ZBH6_FELCA